MSGNGLFGPGAVGALKLQRRRNDLPEGNPMNFGAVPNGVPGGGDTASAAQCYRTRHHNSQLVRPDALYIFGFRTFVAGDDVERHFISLIQGLKTLAYDGGVVNEDVLA